MESLRYNYDRVLLLVAALLALVFGSLLAMKALGLSDSFARNQPEESRDIGEPGAAMVEGASKHLEGDFAWSAPAMPGVPQKKLPLFVSIPILVQNGKEIDLLDPSSPSPRPPFTSDYLYKHRLPVGRTDLAELDPDGDGFNNLEEFNHGKTDPNDPSDHPPFTLKLSLEEVKKDEYSLDYRTGNNPDGEFSIRETTTLFESDPPRTPPRRRSHFKRIGDPFGTHPGHEDRYTITAFKKVMKPGGAGGIDRPAHVLTVEDAKGTPIQITYRDPYVLPTYYVVFRNAFPGAPTDKIGPVKVGDSFEIPNDPGTKYQLLELLKGGEEGAKVRKLGGDGDTPQDLVIPSRQKND